MGNGKKSSCSIQILIAAIVGIIAVCICLCVAISVYPSPTSTPVIEAQVQLTVSSEPVNQPSEPVEEISPLDTTKTIPTLSPIPTSTYTPTPTPIPTATPLLLAPLCAEIISNSRIMTEAQWDKYKEEHLNGFWIVDWQGEIFDVISALGLYEVVVTFPYDCSIYFITDEDTALSFSKGQKVTVTGQIDRSMNLLNIVALYMEDSTVAVLVTEPETGLPEGEPIAKEIISENWYRSISGMLYFVGEIQNTGTVDLAPVKVIVSLKASDGSLVSTKSNYVETSIVYIGEKVPFIVVFLDEPDEWADYKIDVEYQPADTLARRFSYRQFEIIESSGNADSSFYEYVIVGQIQNIGHQDAVLVEIIATLYNIDGNVVGVENTFTELDNVGVMQTSPFELQVWETAGAVDHYSLIVEAIPSN